MKKQFRFLLLLIVPVVLIFLSSFFNKSDSEKAKFKFPWRVAGLTEKQAAAHLISRFTFGETPGEIDEIINTGLEKWFVQQLNAGLPDDSLNLRLADYDALKMSNEQIANTFPRGGQVLRMAVKEGLINKDSVNKTDRPEYRQAVKQLLESKGMKPEAELYRQLINQKILRATYSNNQLRELLTDFWFNHFNVSLTKNDCSQFVLPYERDAIRPNVTARFEDLLLATAKSPAMLVYLDNFTSQANDGFGSDAFQNKQNRERLLQQISKAASNGDTAKQAQLMKRLGNAKKNGGLNENYAREVMELHTLGVDGGYTQKDVTEAARVLTGWTIYPMGDYGAGNLMRNVIDRIGDDKLADRGFVHEGDFLFAANRHDVMAKTVLGNPFDSGENGYQEGVKLMDVLAHRPATAQFICRKLATRFVSDNPPKTLVDKMAKTFLDKDGSIKEVLITMATAPEFWSKDALREKTKSPFELAISTVRSLDADVQQPYQLYNWINKMGQRVYYYQAPTGFPDRGQYWINTGSLLNRMNFGLAIASQKIPGIKFDLLALNHNHEPPSADSALLQFGKILMPERDLTQTVKQLTPILNDPTLKEKIDEAAGKKASNTDPNANATADAMAGSNTSTTMMNNEDSNEKITRKQLKENPKKGNLDKPLPMLKGQDNMMTQVVGIIIGSPEFQRK